MVPRWFVDVLVTLLSALGVVAGMLSLAAGAMVLLGRLPSAVREAICVGTACIGTHVALAVVVFALGVASFAWLARRAAHRLPDEW